MAFYATDFPWSEKLFAIKFNLLTDPYGVQLMWSIVYENVSSLVVTYGKLERLKFSAKNHAIVK